MAIATVAGDASRRLSAFRCCGCDASVEVRRHHITHQIVEARIKATYCKDRFCIPCSRERSARIRSNLLQHMWRRKNAFKGTDGLSLITLTLHHSAAPLITHMDRITAAFKRLRSMPIFKKAVRGGASIIETKLSNDGCWHVHYHLIAECSFISQVKLAEAWQACTGDSYIVDIRRVGALSGAVQYVTKYVTKAADASIVRTPQKLIEAVTAFTARRLVATWGTWRGLKLSENPDETTESADAVWEAIGSLQTVLEAAKTGDTTACAAVHLIDRAPRTPAPQAPT